MSATENLFVIVQQCVYGPEDGLSDEKREIENIYGPYTQEQAHKTLPEISHKYSSYEHMIVEIKGN